MFGIFKEKSKSDIITTTPNNKNIMPDMIDPKLHSILVNGVVFKGSQVLVSQRSLTEAHEPGKWTIPGGKVERTEGNIFNIIESTLAREVLEETGVEIDDEVQPVTNNTFIRSNGQHVVALIFKCLYKSGIPQPLEDTIDCRWASKDQVKEMNFSPNVKEYILAAYMLKG